MYLTFGKVTIQIELFGVMFLATNGVFGLAFVGLRSRTRLTNTVPPLKEKQRKKKVEVSELFPPQSSNSSDI